MDIKIKKWIRSKWRDIGVDGILIGKITGGAELPVLQVSLIASDGSKLGKINIASGWKKFLK